MGEKSCMTTGIILLVVGLVYALIELKVLPIALPVSIVPLLAIVFGALKVVNANKKCE